MGVRCVWEMGAIQGFCYVCGASWGVSLRDSDSFWHGTKESNVYKFSYIYFRKIHPTETRSFPPTPLKWCVGYSFESSWIGCHATPLYAASLGKIA